MHKLCKYLILSGYILVILFQSYALVVNFELARRAYDLDCHNQSYPDPGSDDSSRQNIDRLPRSHLGVHRPENLMTSPEFLEHQKRNPDTKFSRRRRNSNLEDRQQSENDNSAKTAVYLAQSVQTANSEVNITSYEQLPATLQTPKVDQNLTARSDGVERVRQWTEVNKSVPGEGDEKEDGDDSGDYDCGPGGNGYYFVWVAAIVHVVCMCCISATGFIAFANFIRDYETSPSLCCMTVLTGLIGIVSVLTWDRATLGNFENAWQFWPYMSCYFYVLVVIIPLCLRGIYASLSQVYWRERDYDVERHLVDAADDQDGRIGVPNNSPTHGHPPVPGVIQRQLVAENREQQMALVNPDPREPNGSDVDINSACSDRGQLTSQVRLRETTPLLHRQQKNDSARPITEHQNGAQPNVVTIAA